ncbi:MAG: PEP-CTERM sorting domain-containing protein [Candidatus Methylumidiphilus sp.]
MTPKFTLLSAISAVALLSSFSAAASSISFVSSSPITGSINTEPGYIPFQGDYAAFTNSQNIALGHAVTASGTISGFPIIHNVINITDGNYGNGRSWIADGENPALVINLGSIQAFDTLPFGRDRLGGFADRNPGQFTISISNDNGLFTQIFSSALFGFTGSLSAGETVQADFSAVSAEYVKLELENPGTAIDEVEIKLSGLPVPEPTTLALMALGLPTLRLRLGHRSRAL